MIGELHAELLKIKDWISNNPIEKGNIDQYINYIRRLEKISRLLDSLRTN